MKSRLLVCLLAVVMAGCSDHAAPAAVPRSSAVAGSPARPSLPPPPDARYPTAPPAAICGVATLLDGPATAPAGAVPVRPSDDLNAVTQQAAAGTTFWLSPGTYTLGPDEFGQVIPKDGDTYIGAPGAIIDGKKTNRYAFTQQATGVAIRHLTIQNFGKPGANNNEGVVNQSAATGWTVEYNTIRGNAGAGVFIGSHNVVDHNCIEGNEQYGISMYRSTQRDLNSITVDHNEIVGNDAYDWESKRPGCGCTGGAKFWDAHRVTVTGNWIHNNRSVGLWADTNNYGFVIDGNYISDNEDEGLFYEISYNATISNNTFLSNAIVKGRSFKAKGDHFPVSAIYISESGGDARVEGDMASLAITGNYLENNWGGVTLWENANRFCGSPANTSGAYCTLVNPEANLTTCKNGGLVSHQPYFSDCRWKTQNVAVTGNTFVMHPADLGNCDTSYCGHMALLSQYGTYPDWSPYKATKIQDAVTYRQNNQWRANHYFGTWRYVPYDTSNDFDFAKWQALPFAQDPGSSQAR